MSHSRFGISTRTLSRIGQNPSIGTLPTGVVNPNVTAPQGDLSQQLSTGTRVAPVTVSRPRFGVADSPGSLAMVSRSPISIPQKVTTRRLSERRPGKAPFVMAGKSDMAVGNAGVAGVKEGKIMLPLILSIGALVLAGFAIFLKR